MEPGLFPEHQFFVICPTFIWLTLTFFFYAALSAGQEALGRLVRIHRIPCDRCAFYTGECRLKCTVNPCTAFTESAFNCADFLPEPARQTEKLVHASPVSMSLAKSYKAFTKHESFKNC